MLFCMMGLQKSHNWYPETNCCAVIQPSLFSSPAHVLSRAFAHMLIKYSSPLVTCKNEPLLITRCLNWTIDFKSVRDYNVEKCLNCNFSSPPAVLDCFDWRCLSLRITFILFYLTFKLVMPVFSQRLQCFVQFVAQLL